MVEEYQQSLGGANVGGNREALGHHPRLLGMMCTPQVRHFI